MYEALQFPSLAYVWTAWERAGAKTVRVPTDDNRTIPTERICAAITDRTAVVVLSHAYYQSGVLIDVPAIVARARECGALVVLDAYQTTGTTRMTSSRSTSTSSSAARTNGCAAAPAAAGSTCASSSRSAFARW